VSRGLNDQIRTALRGGGHGDVWETATADEEPPECAWCPICRARRRLRESGPGLASHVAAATDVVGVVMQDAVSAFEAAVSAAGRQARPRSGPPAGGEVWDVATDEPGSPSLVEPPGAPAPAQPAAGQATGPAAPETAAGPAAPEPPAGPAAPEPPAAPEVPEPPVPEPPASSGDDAPAAGS
jgi:hypothetical protein